MSSGIGEGLCPLCDGQMLTSFETRPHDFVWGVCLECGYCYWTEPEVISLERLNVERENQDLKLLKQLKVDLKGLDQLRLEHGLEPLEEVPKNKRKALKRVKEEVILRDVSNK